MNKKTKILIIVIIAVAAVIIGCIVLRIRQEKVIADILSNQAGSMSMEEPAETMAPMTDDEIEYILGVQERGMEQDMEQGTPFNSEE